jgi:hypothetical protein
MGLGQVPFSSTLFLCFLIAIFRPPKKHDNLGIAFVDLSNLKDSEPLELALPLSKKGYVKVELTWTSLK